LQINKTVTHRCVRHIYNYRRKGEKEKNKQKKNKKETQRTEKYKTAPHSHRQSGICTVGTRDPFCDAIG